MVPVYSVCSCLGLAFRGMTVYLDVLRDCYEAVVIYEFFQLLLAYIGADIQAQAEVLASKPTMNFVFPLQRWTYRPSRPHFLHYCKIGTLQYVVLRPVTTVLAVVTQLTGKFCEDSMSPRFAHLWIIIVNSISVTVAMFALVQIYTTIKSELKGYHPVLKFVSIKFVIFFSFWQSVTISILSNTHIIHSTPHWSSLEISNSLNAFILCIEMAIAALLHTKAFSYTENLSPDLGPTYRWPAFKHCCFGFYSDFVLDVTVTQRFLTHRIRGETYTPADALNEAEAEGLLETVEDFIEEVAEEVKDAESGVDGAEIRVEKRKGDKTEVVEGKIEGAEGSETTTGAPVKSVVNRTVLEDGEPVVETRKEKDHGGD
ncbi:organic solute transporter Ostalpha-domain-containing protein [Fimicolochytrium jonesii]|uniref:organic solute transporter Ostalpha-domain-containing protein n=1 Tax=Fimicolochytrium jonesii TaxID=1396493 RepID=UPI0022FDB720|nr:organic solute transporter Ostalpha-domain-containing protein [Fimicolochytrium jonesii]KAI8827170.1 organic solute transporter Ostalpha-domain-containing protein [Fimicolochytrium jonesii]